jgi:hypothetical protein
MPQHLVELFRPSGVVEGIERLDTGDADNVHDAGYGAQVHLCFAENSFHVRARRHICLAGVSGDVTRNVGRPAGIAVHTQDGRAGLRQGVSGLLADPLPGAQDHEAAALEVEQVQVLYGGSRHGDYLLLLIFCGRSSGRGRSSSLRR